MAPRSWQTSRSINGQTLVRRHIREMDDQQNYSQFPYRQMQGSSIQATTTSPPMSTVYCEMGAFPSSSYEAYDPTPHQVSNSHTSPTQKVVFQEIHVVPGEALAMLSRGTSPPESEGETL